MSYRDRLKDPRWQRKRLEVMQYAEFRCQVCGSGAKTLNVHHSYYEGQRDPWDYPNGSLLCCCEECHEGIEVFLKRAKSFVEVEPFKPVSKPKKSIQEQWVFKIFCHHPILMRNYVVSLGSIACDAQSALLGINAESLFSDYGYDPLDARLIPNPEQQIEDLALRLVNLKADEAISNLRSMITTNGITQQRQHELFVVLNNIRDMKNPSETLSGAETKAQWLETTCCNEGIPVSFP